MLFFLRQRAFIDLTKDLDLVSRGGLFSLLQWIICIITSFQKGMLATVYHKSSISDPFPVKRGKAGLFIYSTDTLCYLFRLKDVSEQDTKAFYIVLRTWEDIPWKRARVQDFHEGSDP